MSTKYKKVCTALNYIEHLLVLDSAVNECVSISAFHSLVDISIEVESFAIKFKIYAITAKIKKYNSIIKKKGKKHNKIALLANGKLNTKEVLISRALINTNISHDSFVSVNNVLSEYDDIEKAAKNLKTLTVHQIF